MGQPLHVLIVEDSETDTELVVRELRKAGFDPDYKRVDRATDFKDSLENGVWDIIISDYVMPHFSEPAALEILKQSKKDIPFIVISGKIGEDTAVDAMKSGANDYVMKDKLARLTPAVRRELQEANERCARRIAEQELENFVASLTHDLRTPLLAEFRILKSIQSGHFGTMPSELDAVVEEMLHSNHFMQHMVENILYAYKYRQGKVRLELQPTETVAFLSEYVSTVAVQFMLENKNLQLTLEYVDPIPQINIDPHEIRRVLNNLLKNAIDHSPEGSNIKLHIVSQENAVRIGILDQGSGIGSRVEPYLFLPYTNSAASKYHQVGLGLGLYLSKQIVEAHGGKISYQNQPGQGCLFYFDLPAIN